MNWLGVSLSDFWSQACGHLCQVFRRRGAGGRSAQMGLTCENALACGDLLGLYIQSFTCDLRTRFRCGPRSGMSTIQGCGQVLSRAIGSLRPWGTAVSRSLIPGGMPGSQVGAAVSQKLWSAPAVCPTESGPDGRRFGCHGEPRGGRAGWGASLRWEHHIVEVLTGRSPVLHGARRRQSRGRRAGRPTTGPPRR
jgi:hypothetical protein